MQITVDIPDHLAAQAHARGLVLDRYLATLLEADLATGDVQPQPEPGHSSTANRLADLQTLLDRMGRFSDQLPALPEAALPRESFYSDRE